MGEIDPLWVYIHLLILAMVATIWKLGQVLPLVGRPLAYSSVLIGVAAFFGQGWADSRQALPFVQWTIYSSAEVPVQTWHSPLHGGTKGDITSGGVLPVRGTSTRALQYHVYSRASRVQSHDPSASAQAATELREFFNATARMEQARGREPIRAVTLTCCDVSGAIGIGRSGIVCDPSIRIHLDLSRVVDD